MVHAPAPRVHVVIVLSFTQEILIAHVVGTIVDHPAATLNPAGVAAVHVIVHISTVAATLIGAAREVPVLVEYNLYLEEKQYCTLIKCILLNHIVTFC